MAKTEFKTIAQNKKAYHDYFVEETLEAGIELCGTEVKSLRQGRCNLKDAWCSVVDGEMPAISARMSRATSLTATPCGCAVCSCTSARSCGFLAFPKPSVIRSFRFPCTLRVRG